MTTTPINDTPRSGMFYLKVVALGFTVAAMMLGFCTFIPQANAAPMIYLSTGDKIIPGTGGGCNNAWTSGRFMITAGHCGPSIGSTFVTEADVLIGRVIMTHPLSNSNPVGPNTLDYSISRLAPNVVTHNTIYGVAVPYVGMRVYKEGHGVATEYGLNSPVQWGVIAAVTPNGVVVNGMQTTPFDSGSPIISADGGIVALVSGSTDLTDMVRAFLNAAHLPVKPGNTVGPRADRIVELTGLAPN